ncbi:YoaK family protein [Caulobacter endophyticus]|uniref:YoaK family protein n=1 Tax=Caulobacter endophyticus TaxID=2172652 RepID=UPI0024106270|nr:YoaK family protein [Caulobacter endophyticus]MDG2530727.1 YoaK family protein [Caulobacter endophyticus]
MRFPSLSQLMSFNGGYLDTVGFLALQGVFVAHVTGNFVTFGAAMIHGADGAIAKLLVLPVFCAAVVISRLVTFKLAAANLPTLRIMLAVKTVLLIAGSVAAVVLAPFAKGDSWQLILVAVLFVCAMAIQNAAHRVHIPTAPPTTLMTGSTTQIMLDVAELIRGGGPDRGASVARIRKLSAAVGLFAAGCGLGALAFAFGGTWAFSVSAVLAFLSLFSAEARSQRG